MGRTLSESCWLLVSDRYDERRQVGIGGSFSYRFHAPREPHWFRRQVLFALSWTAALHQSGRFQENGLLVITHADLTPTAACFSFSPAQCYLSYRRFFVCLCFWHRSSKLRKLLSVVSVILYYNVLTTSGLMSLDERTAFIFHVHVHGLRSKYQPLHYASCTNSLLSIDALI